MTKGIPGRKQLIVSMGAVRMEAIIQIVSGKAGGLTGDSVESLLPFLTV
jgi:hypothetical protein